jgi:hypothetical protein
MHDPLTFDTFGPSAGHTIEPFSNTLVGGEGVRIPRRSNLTSHESTSTILPTTDKDALVWLALQRMSERPPLQTGSSQTRNSVTYLWVTKFKGKQSTPVQML